MSGKSFVSSSKSTVTLEIFSDRLSFVSNTSEVIYCPLNRDCENQSALPEVPMLSGELKRMLPEEELCSSARKGASAEQN